MIVLTGGAGFIGSCTLRQLNDMGYENILVVDNLGKSEKWKNLVGKNFIDYIHKEDFLKTICKDKNHFGKIDAVIHFGACSSTLCTDLEYLKKNNYNYSIKICKWALGRKARFIYASSAATYGDGKQGFEDREDELEKLKPINSYGYSKHLFDLWLLNKKLFSKVVGLKFFNVFGPNEYHKGEMRSLVHKAFYQIGKTQKIRLFKSHREEYEHGEQKRDFVYVKDCTKIIYDLMTNPQVCGLFNLGSGKANSWNALAGAIFAAMGKREVIEYFDMPQKLVKSYQYFTQAPMEKLSMAPVKLEFTPLVEAIDDYIKNYLSQPKVGYL